VMLAALMITGALQQHPVHRAAARRNDAAAAFDTTTQLVVAVGSGVADVKSSLDLYRRAVFNGPDEDVASSAAGLQTSCREMEHVALVAARRVCRRCGSHDVQVALEGYRAIMPTVARAGVQCAIRIGNLRSLSPLHHAATALRRDVRVIGNAIVEALTTYERRLQVLRVAAGWAEAPVSPLPPPTEHSP